MREFCDYGDKEKHWIYRPDMEEWLQKVEPHFPVRLQGAVIGWAGGREGGEGGETQTGRAFFAEITTPSWRRGTIIEKNFVNLFFNVPNND